MGKPGRPYRMTGPQNRRRKIYEAIVLGSGPAGAATSLALARRGLNVAVLTGPRRLGPWVGETVPPSIKRPLAQLDLWNSFVAAKHRPAPSTVVVWGDARPYENEFIVDPYGMGWHLDRRRFDEMVIEAAGVAGVEVYRDVVPKGSRRNSQGLWEISTGLDSEPFAATWIVDATGRASWFARQQGVKRHLIDRMIALVKFGTLLSADDRTYIEASEYGWWYAAGLPAGRLVLAFFTDADLVARRQSDWENALRETKLISGLAAAAHDLSPVQVIGASSGRLTRTVGPGWLSVGDAARCFDPCSGQGITTALAAGVAAAEAVHAEGLIGGATAAEYSRLVEAEFEKFRTARLAQYRRESRWKDSAFWRRRS